MAPALSLAPCAFRTLLADDRADLASFSGSPLSSKHLYACGPAGFIEAVLDAARAAG